MNDFAKAATNGSLMYNGDFRRHTVELFVVAGTFVAGVLKGIAANTSLSG